MTSCRGVRGGRTGSREAMMKTDALCILMAGSLTTTVTFPRPAAEGVKTATAVPLADVFDLDGVMLPPLAYQLTFAPSRGAPRNCMVRVIWSVWLMRMNEAVGFRTSEIGNGMTLMGMFLAVTSPELLAVRTVEPVSFVRRNVDTKSWPLVMFRVRLPWMTLSLAAVTSTLVGALALAGTPFESCSWTTSSGSLVPVVILTFGST